MKSCPPCGKWLRSLPSIQIPSRSAYRELEAEGYVYTVAGKGTFVAERKEVLGVRNEELMKEFDEVVTELLFLAMDEDSLKTRIEQLAKGERHNDPGS